MAKRKKLDLQKFMDGLIKRNPGEIEFHQAVEEAAKNSIPFVNKHPDYIENQIFERMTEPDRTVIFRVCWKMIKDAFAQIEVTVYNLITPSVPTKGDFVFIPQST